MIWRAGGGAPTHQHWTKEAAQQEAERLARLVPGAAFYVLKAVASVHVPLPAVEWAKTQEDAGAVAPDDVPF
jgi:hypothetical protein